MTGMPEAALARELGLAVRARGGRRESRRRPRQQRAQRVGRGHRPRDRGDHGQRPADRSPAWWRAIVAIREVLSHGHPVLRERFAAVEKFGTPELRA
jgi:hypothetical protein